MIWRINVAVICFLTLVSCKNEKEAKGSEAGAVSLSRDAYFNEDYLMEAEALLELQHDPSVKIIDFRKKEFYGHGHISGAFNL
jgi:thiosulfate/3-mercaptopyruvate sulfurtransferase